MRSLRPFTVTARELWGTGGGAAQDGCFCGPGQDGTKGTELWAPVSPCHLTSAQGQTLTSRSPPCRAGAALAVGTGCRTAGVGSDTGGKAQGWGGTGVGRDTGGEGWGWKGTGVRGTGLERDSNCIAVLLFLFKFTGVKTNLSSGCIYLN